MKKVTLTFLTLVLVSCSSTVKRTESKSLFEVLTQQSDGGASIRFFEILSEPDEIAMLKNDEKLKDKIQPNDILTSNFIVLNMGEKATGGYQIGVENVLETEKNVILTIKETVPKPDATVLQVITSPYCVVRINSKKEIIIK